MNASTLFAAITSNDASMGMGMAWIFIAIAIGLLGIIAFWRVFTKAKRPGWASIIPIYNVYVLLKIVGRPGWWLLLYLIPVVNIITHIIVAIDSAKAFGKSTAFGFFGLWLFSIIGYMILGFGDAKYKGVPKR
ncbi:MAG TPA: DUF5684 domain-containing protein [Patescibacteria group bacterium]|nr:DUF5684 domain-containing protein [Patescibacteria group bacterium]